MLNQSESLD